jgi:hypothetical protein
LHRLGDCLAIAEIVLLSLAVRADVFRRHQPSIVAKRLEFATEMMRADAGFHADQSYLNCLAKEVIIVDSPRGSNLSSTEDKLGFWMDEAAKTIMLADGTALTVHRFDDHWISADRGDLHYEFDRQNGNLMYASSTTKEGVATTTIGSGRCEIAASPE